MARTTSFSSITTMTFWIFTVLKLYNILSCTKCTTLKLKKNVCLSIKNICIKQTVLKCCRFLFSFFKWVLWAEYSRCPRIVKVKIWARVFHPINIFVIYLILEHFAFNLTTVQVHPPTHQTLSGLMKMIFHVSST